MADDNRFRSTRPGDAYRRAADTPFPNERVTGSDPLAELARLIGKNDPYAEFGLSASHEEQPKGAPAAMSRHDDYASPQEQYDERYHEPYPDSGTDPRESYEASHEAYAGNARSSAHEPSYENWPSHHATPYREPRFADEVGEYAGAVGSQDEQAAHPDEHRLDDEAEFDEHAEQMYDDPPRAYRRGGLATALALVGCALVGTAGAYAYRSYYGQPVSTQPPPVITADSSVPTKIVPVPARDAQSTKVIQDRLANAGRNRSYRSRRSRSR